jgi:hypothetical protein
MNEPTVLQVGWNAGLSGLQGGVFVSADNAIIVMESLGWWEVWHELKPHRDIRNPPKKTKAWKYKTQAMAYAEGLKDGLGNVEYGIIVKERARSDG